MKELQNCILFIIRAWSLFCSVRVYISLHFLPILLIKLDFDLSVISCFYIFGFKFLCSMFWIQCDLKSLNRSNHRRCSIKKDVLTNVTKFTGKHLCQSLFLTASGSTVYLYRSSHWRRSEKKVGKNDFLHRHFSRIRSSRAEVFCKKGVLKNFTKFTGKNQCQSLFFIKLQPEACNFIKKETLAHVCSCEFCKIFKNIYFYRTPLVANAEGLWQ